ncbi:cytochrome P450 4d2-like [Euwallacea similis]|uniref:cytochrome P450 4d2-like n=1 Tax=Euwallacea similis TaxID=1736056 RepID=UPI0034510C2E
MYHLNISILLCVILTVIVVWLIAHLLKIYRHLNEFPTNPFVPIFGHVFDYVNPHKTLITLTDNLYEYGGTIRQYLGPKKPSLITANKNFLQFLCNNNKYICKSVFYKFLKPWLGEGLVTSDGQKWLSRRRALTSCFTQSTVLKDFVGVFDEKSESLIGSLSIKGEGSINLHPIMKQLTLDIICETAMGVSRNPQESSKDGIYSSSIETLCEVIQNRMTSAWKIHDFCFRFSRDYFREKSALAVVDGMFDLIVQKKLEKTSVKGEKKTMLDLLMEITIDGKPLSRDDLREEINTFMFAGYDTTSTAMSLAVYEIARHPDVQAKLYEEQRTIFSKGDVQVSYEKLEKMSYLQMVILETLRLHTIISFIGKRVKKDLFYDGKKIPALLNIVVFIHGFHHNSDYFPNPYEFTPERFSSKNKIDEFTYMPFGVKPRQCLGKNFAMLEMKCVLSKIIRNFEVMEVPERPLKLEPKLVLFSSSGIWISVKKRAKWLER